MEVYFFVLLACADIEIPVALVSLYSSPHADLLCISSNTLCSCEYQGDKDLRFIDVKTIQAVVAIVPHKPVIGPQEPMEHYFLVEKPGFDISQMARVEEELLGDSEESTVGPDNTAVL